MNFTLTQLIKSRTVYTTLIWSLLAFLANAGILQADVPMEMIDLVYDRLILILQDYDQLIIAGNALIMRIITTKPLSEK